MGRYQNLRVWQDSRQLVLEVYRCTRLFPREEVFGITAQMRRAAASIPANIAEGSERNSRREFERFLRIASGSLAELRTFVGLSHDLGFLETKLFQPLEHSCSNLDASINAFVASFERSRSA